MTPKALIRRAIPVPLRKRLDHAWYSRRLPAAEPVDVEPLHRIREASLEQLRDPAWLETDLLPALGLNNESLAEFPRALYPFCGKGLRHWQYPVQFAPYLAFLSGLGIRTYLEIGVRHGGTFLITTEYLTRFNRIERATATATDLIRSDFLTRAVAVRPGEEFVVANSQLPSFQRVLNARTPVDLAFVDGDHSEEGCQNDLDLVRDRARVVVLHDIVSSVCPGVPVVWNRFKAQAAGEWTFHEFVEQYDEVLERQGAPYLGIGVAVRR